MEKEETNKMRKILMSLMIIGITATMFGAGTLSYFSDSEIAAGNTFSAGTIDLKIDCHSTHMQQWPCGGTIPVENPIIFGLKDLVPGDKIFDWSDIKPGDFGEATISFHVYNNDAWLWLRFTNIMGDPELAQNIEVRLWKDEGVHDGFGNDPIEFTCDGVTYVDETGLDEKLLSCCCNGGEGDNVWQCTWEPVIFEGTLAELLQQMNPLFTQLHIQACTNYYMGWAWWVPTSVGNEIQGDSVSFDIEFYAQQYRNNPNPVDPWA